MSEEEGEAEAAAEGKDAGSPQTAEESVVPQKDLKDLNKDEAWKTLMQSMTEFIGSTSKLMKTLNEKEKLGKAGATTSGGAPKCEGAREGEDCKCEIVTCPEKKA